MPSLIDRYIYDVVRRLPEKERDDVSRELYSSIMDMLPDNADDPAVEAVLRQLGAPALLAEQYRQTPRYLISPAAYDTYIRALKLVLPLVGGIVLVIGMVLGGIDAISGGEPASGARFVSSVLSSGISMGLEAALQALVWTTLGFFIAERSGAFTGKNTANWSPADLPEVPANDKGRIPLSDSIVELALTLVFGVIFLLWCLNNVPVAFSLQWNDTRVLTLFSESFKLACIPATIVLMLFDAAECIAKIAVRRWTPAVCITVILSNLASIAIVPYLLTRPDMFSAEFANFLHTQKWAQLDILRFMGQSSGISVLTFIAALVVVGCVVSSILAIYRTVKARSSQLQ